MTDDETFEVEIKQKETQERKTNTDTKYKGSNISIK